MKKRDVTQTVSVRLIHQLTFLSLISKERQGFDKPTRENAQHFLSRHFITAREVKISLR